jgi:adenylosuccinate lyase
MIPRYSRPEMTAVWSPETRFRIWFEIEAYASEAMAEIGGENDLGEGLRGQVRRGANRRN